MVMGSKYSLADMTRDEYRGVYKAIGMAKRELTLKAIEDAALGHTENAIAILNQVGFYEMMESNMLKILHCKFEPTDTVDAIEPEELMNPTDLGKKVGLSANHVNQRLVSLGFQHGYRMSGTIRYVLTDAGKKYGFDVPSTGTHTAIRWKPSVICHIKK